MKIEKSYTFQIDGTTIVLSEQEAQELYQQLRDALGYKEATIDTIKWPKEPQYPWQETPLVPIPYSPPTFPHPPTVWCENKPTTITS